MCIFFSKPRPPYPHPYSYSADKKKHPPPPPPVPARAVGKRTRKKGEKAAAFEWPDWGRV
jgi:hypothetical protein